MKPCTEHTKVSPFRVFWIAAQGQQRNVLISMAVQLLVALAVTRLSFVVPELIRDLIDVRVPKGDVDAILMASALIVTVPVGSRIITSIAMVFRVKLVNGLQYEMQEQTLVRILDVPLDASGRISSGDVLAVIGSDCPSLVNGVITLTENALQTVYALALAVRLLWGTSPAMVAACLVAALIRFPVQRWIANLSARSVEMRRKWQSATSTALIDTLAGAHTVKTYSLERSRCRFVGNLFKSAFADAYRLEKVIQVSACSETLLNAIAPAVAYGYGSYLMVTGHVTVGGVIAAAQYLTRVIDSMGTLVAVVGRARPLQVHAEKIASVLSLETEVESGTTWAETSIRVLSLNGVCFRYDAQPDMLLDCAQVRVSKGEIVALCGRSGVGKTTMAHLLCGLVRPLSGSIMANDCPVTRESQKGYRLHTAMVSDQDHIFMGSIRDNLLMVNPAATASDIDTCLRLSKLDRLVSELPDRLDTRIGRGGLQLSSGERQRLSLARAILRDPQVVVLDEATANIDLTTEHSIFEGLMPWLRMRIALVISHRPQTLTWADRVLCLDEGNIRQVG